MVEILIKTGQLKKVQRTMEGIKNGVPRVLAPAINRALDKGRTEVRREIRKIYLIKQKDIPIHKNGASYAHLNGSLVISQGMLPLDKFDVRPRGVQKRKVKKVLYARVKKSGGGPMPGAFYIPTGGPYVRTGNSRLPIKRLLTIGASIMASQPTVGPAASKAMSETLDKRIDHEIKRVLAKGK